MVLSDSDAWTGCLFPVPGICGICPVVQLGFPDGAMDRIEAWQEISNHMTGIFSNRHSPSENNALLTKMSSTLARCTSCGLCATICESGISTAPLWGSMRGACSEMGFKEPLVEKNSALILRKKNPNDGEISSRTAWIPPSVHIADSAPIGYFPGCTIAFRQPELGKAVLRVLHQAGVSFCMLGNDQNEKWNS